MADDTAPALSTNGKHDPAPTVPAHQFTLAASEGYRVAIQIAFAKAMPYDMADAIKRGEDPLNAFVAALGYLQIQRVMSEVVVAEAVKEPPLIVPATSMPRILRPR